MTSERKRRANRANARKSTGPRSATGRKRSSRNATVHGLTGEPPASEVTAWYRLILDDETTMPDPLDRDDRNQAAYRLALAEAQLKRVMRAQEKALTGVVDEPPDVVELYRAELDLVASVPDGDRPPYAGVEGRFRRETIDGFGKEQRLDGDAQPSAADREFARYAHCFLDSPDPATRVSARGLLEALDPWLQRRQEMLAERSRLEERMRQAIEIARRCGGGRMKRIGLLARYRAEAEARCRKARRGWIAHNERS